MRCDERHLDVSCGRLRAIAEALAIDGAVIGKILAIGRLDPFAADEIAVAGGKLSFRADEIESVLRHGVFLFRRFAADLKPAIVATLHRHPTFGFDPGQRAQVPRTYS